MCFSIRSIYLHLNKSARLWHGRLRKCSISTMNSNDIKLPPNQNFGFLFVAIFVVASGYFWFLLNSNIALFILMFAAALLFISFWKPRLLAPFNQLWMRFGLFLGAIVGPIVMALLFFILFTPIAVVLRVAGRDELRIKRPKTDSYWKNRKPPGPDADSFPRQF